MLKVSIQGVAGSFHDIVARDIFGNEITLIEQNSFKLVFEDVKKQKVNFGIVAIENSIAGSIFSNYDLLEKYQIPIVGEYYLRIKHNLLSLPGQKISDIHEVWSHPMALLQCQHYLESINLKTIEKEDTAGSAKEIRNNKLFGIAAIASELAGELYKLKTLKAGIEDNKQNYTRFLILGQKPLLNPEIDKSSIVVELKHQPGSLAKLISIFAKEKINLTKIESRPIIGRPFEYKFYLDFQENIDKKLLNKLSKHTVRIKTLGSYQSHSKTVF